MSKTVLRVYTDPKSPYAFIALAPTYELELEYDLVLDWYPYQLQIADYLGSVEERTEHQWRRVRYGYMDARRLANQQGLTLKGPEKIFDGYPSCVGMLFAKKKGFLRAYNEVVFKRFWRRELDVDSIAEVRRVIETLGGDGTAYAAYADGPGHAEHEAVRNEAEAMGVFGVPTFVLNGELFFGGDRIPQLKRTLDALGVPRNMPV